MKFRSDTNQGLLTYQDFVDIIPRLPDDRLRQFVAFLKLEIKLREQYRNKKDEE